MKKKVLIACECSQIVAKAFREVGIECYSNDIMKSYGGHPEWHIVGDALEVIKGCSSFELESGDKIEVPSFWDMIIAHPPCTMLTHASSVALSKGLHTLEDVKLSAEFFMKILNAPVKMLAVENPAPLKLAELPPYNQKIQPYEFGHKYSKRVCLWLRGLPPLLPMRAQVLNHEEWLRHCSHKPKRRSKTFEYIAEAMAIQWGSLL